MEPGADLLRTVSLQLGRRPGIDFEVALECTWRWPAVLANEPYTRSGRPNPNLFHLSCPYLRRELAVMEDQGAIARLEELIRSRPELEGDLKNAQADHRARWLKLSEGYRGPERPEGEPSQMIAPPNIAAAGDELKLKCLHAHVAWFLVNPAYLVGEEIVTMMGKGLWCPDDACRRMTGR